MRVLRSACQCDCSHDCPPFPTHTLTANFVRKKAKDRLVQGSGTAIAGPVVAHQSPPWREPQESKKRSDHCGNPFHAALLSTGRAQCVSLLAVGLRS